MSGVVRVPNANATAITAFLDGPPDLSNKERHVLTTECDMMLRNFVNLTLTQTTKFRKLDLDPDPTKKLLNSIESQFDIICWVWVITFYYVPSVPITCLVFRSVPFRSGPFRPVPVLVVSS